MSKVTVEDITEKLEDVGVRSERTLRVILPACPSCGEKRKIAVNRETGLNEEVHCWNLTCDTETFSLLENIAEITYKQEVKASK